MNPPFIAWSALSPEQRETMRAVLGAKLEGRGDFSMAFLVRALSVLAPGGAVGTLMPASLLTLQAAEAWRKHLLDNSDLCFIASLGDYGLFSHALVQVAAAVFRKPKADAQSIAATALVTGNDAEATGNALRALRKAGPVGAGMVVESDAWRLFRIPVETCAVDQLGV
jgi:hypothetical protein